ncbi:PKD domain-containing protein [Streptomyces zagrosensis]|uniref:Chitodextrinase n=1 Tax=Streptomyces zagrosensis TaxID=1042984 RepID=A0A7W9Q9B6_9ACTN|nr:PKD domain-containing protein [Streptomyces zagrosensis]MBB5935052.1 chitodextrinase [Streptomyces zagrosensis]
MAPTAHLLASCLYEACTFDGRVSLDLDDAIGSYAWDYGDGSTGSEPAPSHTYRRVGQYRITLTVTDEAGHRDSAARLVACRTGSGTRLSCSVTG